MNLTIRKQRVTAFCLIDYAKIQNLDWYGITKLKKGIRLIIENLKFFVSPHIGRLLLRFQNRSYRCNFYWDPGFL